MFTDLCFRPPVADSTISTRANVTTTTFQNIYAYAPEKLWLAYGLALFFAFVTAMIGFSAMLNSRACYQNTFSTILRSTKNAYISENLRPEELSGQDPLPNRLRNCFVIPGKSEPLLDRGVEFTTRTKPGAESAQSEQ
jgi:hypothetical protein